MGDKFKALFEEVKRSNMSKACVSESEAKDTVDFYLKKDIPTIATNACWWQLQYRVLLFTSFLKQRSSPDNSDLFFLGLIYFNETDIYFELSNLIGEVNIRVLGFGV